MLPSSAEGKSRGGHDGTYEITVRKPPNTLQGGKILCSANRAMLLAEVVRRGLDHLRVAPPDGS